MAVCQAITFKSAPSVQTSTLFSCSVVAKKTATTFFFISCVKCLWDFVGRFLGSSLQPDKPLSAGHYSPIFGDRKKRCCDRFK
jgi:hypothetical protein